MSKFTHLNELGARLAKLKADASTATCALVQAMDTDAPEEERESLRIAVEEAIDAADDMNRQWLVEWKRLGKPLEF